MAAKNLIIHLGVHKTGSTAIQHYLWRHTKALAEHGVHYPVAGRPALEAIQFGHHDVPWSLAGRPDAPVGVLNQLSAEIEANPAHTTIISSEEFDRIGPAEIEVLAKHISIPTRIVIYYRRQSDIMQGMYATDVVHDGERRDIVEYMQEFRGELDFLALARRWSAVFGKENMLALRYDRRSFPKGNIVPNFLSALTLSELMSNTEEIFEYNNSLPWYAVLSVQMMWRAMLPQEIVKKVVDALYAICRMEPAANGFLLPSQARAFDLRFTDSNAQFQAEFCPGDDPITPHTSVEDDIWIEERAGLLPAVQRMLLAASQYVARVET